MDFRSEAMATKIRKTEKRIHRMTKVVANRAVQVQVQVAASRAAQVMVVQVQVVQVQV